MTPAVKSSGIKTKRVHKHDMGFHRRASTIHSIRPSVNSTTEKASGRKGTSNRTRYRQLSQAMSLVTDQTVFFGKSLSKCQFLAIKRSPSGIATNCGSSSDMISRLVSSIELDQLNESLSVLQASSELGTTSPTTGDGDNGAGTGANGGLTPVSRIYSFDCTIADMLRSDTIEKIAGDTNKIYPVSSDMPVGWKETFFTKKSVLSLNAMSFDRGETSLAGFLIIVQDPTDGTLSIFMTNVNMASMIKTVNVKRYFREWLAERNRHVPVTIGSTVCAAAGFDTIEEGEGVTVDDGEEVEEKVVGAASQLALKDAGDETDEAGSGSEDSETSSGDEAGTEDDDGDETEDGDD